MWVENKCKYCNKFYLTNRYNVKQNIIFSTYCSYACRAFALGYLGGSATAQKYGGWSNLIRTPLKIRAAACRLGGRTTHLLHPQLSIINAYKSVKTNKKNNTGIYGMTHSQHVIAGKNSANINKLNQTGIFNPVIRANAQQKANATNKRNGTGIYGLTPEERIKAGKKSAKVNKLNKTGWYNLEFNRKNRENIAKNRRSLYIFKNVYFDSKCECEIAICLYHQFNLILEHRRTVHFAIDRFEIDFFVESLKLFVEWRGWDRVYKLNVEKYYKDRHKILDANGYVDYKLVVLS